MSFDSVFNALIDDCVKFLDKHLLNLVELVLEVGAPFVLTEGGWGVYDVLLVMLLLWLVAQRCRPNLVITVDVSRYVRLPDVV